MTIPQLGQLERVDLRSAWQNEAQSFTPWLAQEPNLRVLGTVIGLELELEAVEKSVGPFRADILCKALDDSDDHQVLIENQLEQTDHKHLGQILTYVAGLNARTVVWIARRFSDEHRAAIDWLNTHTVAGVNFFAVEVEVWRIGNSAMAPKFNLVSHPNDWARSVAQVARAIANEADSEIQAMRLRFWTTFREYHESHPGLVPPRTPSTSSSLGFALGRSNFRMNAQLNFKDGWVWVAVVIRGSSRWEYLRALEQQRSAIESELGFTMEWPASDETASATKDVWIVVSRKTELEDESTWPDAIRWLRETLETIRRTLEPRIRSIP